MKKQLLDPLGTMCKLVGLNFTKLKTKISIHQHVLTLDEPNELQFLIRWYNEDGRENISELYYVIIRIVKWYLVRQKPINHSSDLDLGSELNLKRHRTSIDIDSIDDLEDIDDDDEPIDVNNFEQFEQEEDSKSTGSIKSHTSSKSINVIQISESEALRKMIRYLCIAFTKLQETYEFGNVVLAIQFFINLLEDALNGNFDETKLPKYILEKDKEYESLIDYEKMKGIWKLKTLETICELYDNCFRVQNDTEIPERTKSALIEGYLRSVGATLEITDKEFQTLISNSRKG